MIYIHTKINSNIISSLKEDLNDVAYKNLLNGFDFKKTVVGYLNSNGNVASDARFVTSDFFEVNENKIYYAIQMVGTTIYKQKTYICFYNKNKEFIN